MCRLAVDDPGNLAARQVKLSRDLLVGKGICLAQPRSKVAPLLILTESEECIDVDLLCEVLRGARESRDLKDPIKALYLGAGIELVR